MMCAAPPLRVEPERPLDEGTEWIAGRWTESWYSADCGIADSQQNILGRIGGLLSLLSYIMSLYPSLDLHTVS